MKKILFLICCIISVEGISQKYAVDKGEIIFFSHAAIEDITANNKKISGLFDIETSEVAFSLLIKEFNFKKSLMQEHFNEKYMESEKYPKATFSGKISNFNPSADGEQKVTATGKLTIHGVTKEVEIPGTIQKQKKDGLMMKSKFIVKLADYNISIPQLLWQNIAEQVEVTVNLNFKKKQ